MIVDHHDRVYTHCRKVTCVLSQGDAVGFSLTVKLQAPVLGLTGNAEALHSLQNCCLSRSRSLLVAPTTDFDAEVLVCIRHQFLRSVLLYTALTLCLPTYTLNHMQDMCECLSPRRMYSQLIRQTYECLLF